MGGEGSEREYNTQRTVGVWLVYVGVIIIVSAIMGGDLFIHPFIMGFGYFIGFFLILVLPFLNNKLSYGKNSKFQDRMDNISVVVTIVLCTICGLIIGSDDLRLLWLCIFTIIGIHFFGFYFSQGKIILLLGVLTTVNSIMGILLVSVPFLLFAMIDGILKVIYGFKMLLMKRQTKNSNMGDEALNNFN
ncbi:DUF6609 family protein [Gracilibacillus dipsosauri]|uniref:DUF308 domain-containing protein n=1 Tax=Gracilibacillus dipsosauri TaxID=178340 RepID=A0A317L265_9BACI|nr:DUF6609 family protein [Gracilibacillus dipsosauri]PWU67879.1 hypothetical protein DLJ74_12255 [Gracilibacillus dipsosauri]